MSSWASLPVYQDSTMVPIASTKAKIAKPTTATCSEPSVRDMRMAKFSNHEEGGAAGLDGMGSTGPFPCTRTAVSILTPADGGAACTAVDACADLCGGAAAPAEGRDFLRDIRGHSR